MSLIRAFLLAAAILTACPAHAEDSCKALVLRDVAAVENPTSFLKRGSYYDVITQYRVNRKTGLAIFCSHGGYCYPAKAMRLTNCKVGKAEPTDNSDADIYYDVDIIRSKWSPADLRLEDLTNKLIEMGLCNACAQNVAHLYFAKPSSKCALLTKKAVEGDQVALSKLADFPNYCNVKSWK